MERDLEYKVLIKAQQLLSHEQQEIRNFAILVLELIKEYKHNLNKGTLK